MKAPSKKMKIGFVLQKGNGIMHITQNAFKINNLDTDERLGCREMREDGKNSWLARNRGGGKVARWARWQGGQGQGRFTD